MDIVILFLRFFIGILFLSTAWTKGKDWGNHINSIKKYEIISNSVVVPFAIVSLGLELICSTFLMLGIYQTGSSFFLTLLLVCYAIAITINLTRKRKDLTCGCGGFAGNNSISWILVLRNITLMFMCISLMFWQTPLFSFRDIYTLIIFKNGEKLLKIIPIILSSLASLIFVNSIMELKNIWVKVKALIQ